jgi:1,4-dihydroxy-2-naphthoyl-CoA synthase
VDAVTEDGGCVELAVAWGLEVAKAAPLAAASLKALLGETLDPAVDVRARERERFIAAWTSDDHADAVEAFFARRAPRWAGR